MQNWASVFWNHDLFLDNHDRLPCKMNIFKLQLMRQYSKATWVALTSARFCARARRRFSPQNRALGLSVFGNHIVVAKLVEAARAKLFSHRTARIERFENYPFMTDDHKSSFMFAKYYLFL